LPNPQATRICRVLKPNLREQEVMCAQTPKLQAQQQDPVKHKPTESVVVSRNGNNMQSLRRQLKTETFIRGIADMPSHRPMIWSVRRGQPNPEATLLQTQTDPDRATNILFPIRAIHAVWCDRSHKQGQRPLLLPLTPGETTLLRQGLTTGSPRQAGVPHRQELLRRGVLLPEAFQHHNGLQVASQRLRARQEVRHPAGHLQVAHQALLRAEKEEDSHLNITSHY
jgi:hypothetical protein